MKVKVVTATQELIDQIKGKLRQADIEECKASSGMEADDALQYSFEISRECNVALVDGEPFIAFGVASWATVETRGFPWLLATDKIENAPLQVAAISKKYITRMAKRFDLLENWVDTRNSVSKRWLEWCGFNIEEPKPFGAKGLPFHRFWLIKEQKYV